MRTIPSPDVAPLFQPLKLGAFELKHRIVLAPLTRSRAINCVPVKQSAEYYAQRATDGGLLIAEATPITPSGHGYPHTPGIYTPEQIEAWKPITAAVKEKGGVFFLQLWHVGRASHNSYQPGGAPPVSASAIAIGPHRSVLTQTPQPEGGYGPFPFPVPHALTSEEIPGIVALYAQAARNALEAGFDGVEIHGANGYLIEQFLKPSSNTRTDEYGGSIPNRARFLLQVVQSVAEAIGAERVGLRLSPFNQNLDAFDPTPYDTMAYVIPELNKVGLAYIHMVEPRIQGSTLVEGEIQDSLLPLKRAYQGTFIAAGGHDRESGIEAISSGAADAVAYGRWFLSNPDLPKRFLLNARLNEYDRDTFYTQDPVVGYLDYPFLTSEEEAAAGAAMAPA